jgi:Caleosin related protein
MGRYFLIPSFVSRSKTCTRFVDILYISPTSVIVPRQGKHGSDTEIYTTIGEFDEIRFNYMFDMYSSPPQTHLTAVECVRMLHGNMNPFDPVGVYFRTVCINLNDD